MQCFPSHRAIAIKDRPNPLDPALLLSALREQLGFTLTSQKAAVDFLILDSAEKVAAGN